MQKQRQPNAPKVKRAKPTLTRVGLVRINSSVTLADLEKKLRTTGVTQRDTKAVRLNEIKIADKVFQWRRRGHNLVTSADHVFGLAKAIENSGKAFGPILVLPAGKHYYVIDGHHRVEAYHSVKWTGSVPIEVFHGSLQEARIEGFLRNSKDKLPMSKDDKMEGTWTLVKEGAVTVEKMSDITGTSERQIYYMRSAWKQLCDLPVEQGSDRMVPVAQLSWTQAKTRLSGMEIEQDIDDWKEKKAQKIVDALLKAKIGQGLLKHPDVTAIALERLSGSLPRALVHSWYSPDELREMADEIGEYEF